MKHIDKPGLITGLSSDVTHSVVHVRECLSWCAALKLVCVNAARDVHPMAPFRCAKHEASGPCDARFSSSGASLYSRWGHGPVGGNSSLNTLLCALGTSVWYLAIAENGTSEELATLEGLSAKCTGKVTGRKRDTQTASVICPAACFDSKYYLYLYLYLPSRCLSTRLGMAAGAWSPEVQDGVLRRARSSSTVEIP